MLDIGYLIFEQAMTTSISLPVEMVNAANQRSITLKVAPLNQDYLSINGGIYTLLGGFKIDTKPLPIPYPKVLVIPATWRSPLHAIKSNRLLLNYIRDAHEAGSTIVSVGNGAFFPAEAGLLEQKSATTHWHFFEHFKRRYPNIRLLEDYFITGVDNIYCTGSINAMADLTVYLIEQSVNKEVSMWVQRNFSHEIRHPFQEIAFIDGGHNHSDELISFAEQIVRDGFARNDLISYLMTELSISPRTLNRRFKQATGLTPNQYVQKRRITVAKELIHKTNLAIGEIAYKVGYQDVSFFAQLFRRELGMTPAEYRKTVRAKLFNDERPRGEW